MASHIDQQGPGRLAQTDPWRALFEGRIEADFELLPGTVKVRPGNLTALSVRGMLKRPGQQPVSIEEMDEGIAVFLEQKHGRKR